MPYMTSTIIRNFLTRKATRPYPIEVRDPFPETRGELVNDIEKCIVCSACARNCPSQCITIEREAGIWECDPFACVYCGVCVEVCPVNCLSQNLKYRSATRDREYMKLTGVPPKPKKKKEKSSEEETSS